MTADHNWLHPSWDWLRNTVQDDGLTEHGSAENITDLCHSLRSWPQRLIVCTHRAVRALPHLFELELLHASLVWRDRRTLDADFVLKNGIGGFDGYLIIGLSPYERVNQCNMTKWSIPDHGTRGQDRST